MLNAFRKKTTMPARDIYHNQVKNALIKNDEQFLHVTRYLHLNPVTAGIVDKPENWKYSSYLEYIGRSEKLICDFKDYISLASKEYQKFVEDGIGYQKELSKIKHLIME